MSGDAPSRDELIAGSQAMRTIREFEERVHKADIASLVAANAYDALRGPVRMVTAPHAPTPFSPVLEDAYAPSAAQIASAVLATQSTARETEPAS